MDFEKIKSVARMLKLSGREDVSASSISDISEDVISITESELDSIPRDFKTLIEGKVHVMDFKNNKLVLKPVTIKPEDDGAPKLNKLSDYEKDGGDAKKQNKKMIDNDLTESFFELFENFISSDRGNPHLPYNADQIRKAEDFLRKAKSKLEKATTSSQFTRKEREVAELDRIKNKHSRERLASKNIKSNLSLQKENAEDAIAFSKKEFSDEDHEQYHGLDDVRSVTVKIPRSITTDITKRISEIERSIKAYDDKGYNDGSGANSNKNKAIDALNQIKANLSSRDYEGFKEAQLFYLTLMSPITDLFPASLVNFLANAEDVNIVGSNSSEEVKPFQTELKESNLESRSLESGEKKFRITYEIVSPESAEMGDAEDRGWEDEEGVDVSPDGDDSLTVVDAAVEFLTNRGAVYPSSEPYTGGDIWFTDEGDTDYRTGNVKTLSYHPVGFSEEELGAIYNRLKGRPVSESAEAVGGSRQYTSLEEVYDVGSTEIWYMKPEFFRDGTMGYKFLQKQDKLPNPQDISKTHVLLGRVSETDPNRIYHMMQGEQWSPRGEARSMIRAKGLSHTTMTVGDIIVLPQHGAVLVDNNGFTPLQDRSVETTTMESINLTESYMYTNKSKFDRYFKNSVLPTLIKKFGPNDKPAIRTGYNDTIDSLIKGGNLPDSAKDWIVPETFLKPKTKVTESKKMRDYLIETKKKMKKDPCWKGYEMVGMKKGDSGEEVPNCAPKDK